MNRENLAAFASAPRFSLHRLPNGWLLKRGANTLIDTGSDMSSVIVFESTESLAEQLPEILGKSGWRISIDKPKRDKQGHFLPKGLAK